MEGREDEDYNFSTMEGVDQHPGIGLLPEVGAKTEIQFF